MTFINSFSYLIFLLINRRNLNKIPDVSVCTLESFYQMWGLPLTIPVSRACANYKIPDALSNVQHVIVDEAHNFTIWGEFNWFEAVCELQNSGSQRGGEKGYLWVFCDMYQQEYIGETGLPSLREQDDKYGRYTLTDVVRTTKTIFKRTQEDHDTQPTLCHNYSGSISFFPYKEGGCENMIKELIHKHISDNKRPYADIVVLTSDEFHADILRKELPQKLGLKADECVSAEDPCAESGRLLVVDSIRRYGGLEKTVVIVVDYKLRYGFLGQIDCNQKGFRNQVLTRTLDTIYFIQPHRHPTCKEMPYRHYRWFCCLHTSEVKFQFLFS